ncbi:MAG: winged helix-turn-helix domain-containing protein [Pararobbsia sp.]
MIRIGNFQVDFEQREIWRGGATLRVGSRALDILQVLIDADGALVSKDEIMQRVWPHSFVEENNLQVQIAWLRKAFGEDRDLIRTVPGRGYQLIAPKGLAASAPGLVPLGTKLRLPANASKLVGRDAMVSEIAARLGEVSELTLVGAGGIGKTSLAIEVAHKIGEQFRDGVYFLELAALSDTNAVLAAVAETCGTPFAYDAVSAKRIAQALADSQCLIVLDNAEHVIEAVAELVCALVARAPGLRVLATSREPLRVANESIFRVQPLAVPAVGAPPDEVFSHAAVQLFLSRARAIDIHFGVDLRSARLIGDICRRLDGIALAIELAAARAATLA